jgi:ankyrin repeat protein
LGNPKMTRALLTAGADPNSADRSGRTAFIWTARNCNLDAASLLIAAGANPAVRDNFGYDAAYQSGCSIQLNEIVRARGLNNTRKR